MIPALTGILAPHGLATSFESIATVTVGSGGASSIDFSSISGTYTHLQIRGISRSTSTGQNLYIQLNGDTAANYSYHSMYGDGTSAAAANSTGASFMYAGYTSQTGTTANTFGTCVIDILDYNNTNKYKTIRSLNGMDANGSGILNFASGSWRNTNTVTSISLYINTGNLAQYSTFALYGVKS